MERVWEQAELVATMPTRIGLLSDVCKALSEHGIDIRSIEAYDNDDTGSFYLITSDDDLAASALTQMGADLGSVDVVCVELENRPGALQDLATRIADGGMNIWQMRATGTPTSHTALVVFRVDDPRALAAMLQAA